MAAYAALVSLMNTLNKIQIHPRISTFLHQEHIKSLLKITDFLLHFIESSNSHGGSREEEVLESQIACAAHAAEDVIESHVADQIHAAGSTGGISSSSLLDLEGVIEDLNSVKERVMELEETKECTDLQPLYSIVSISSKPLTTTKNVMVGFDEELNRFMDRLFEDQSNLLIVPIVGMGGIGKTTLARNVYENSLIVKHFQIRAWVTISQDYSVVKILSELRLCLEAFDFETDLETEDQLGLKLYQSLTGRKFLIVLDDIWSFEVWDKIKFFFPDNDNSSRVILTTRISNVATRLSSSSFEMNFLDEDKSWKLFCWEVFLEEGCPPKLENIGKKIVRECKGLPLAIVVIGGLLRNSKSTREYWENLATDLNSFLMSDNDDHCLNILSLSYNHLPAHLKSYFLHMGVFSEDEQINVSQLIKLFVAEGFLKPKKGRTLEDVAEDYLKDLVDRNLILVDSWKWNGRIKYCKMHDLVREVCLKTGKRKKFFHGMRMFDIPLGVKNRDYDLPFDFKLSRVYTCFNFNSLEAISEHVNLRYLAFKPSSNNLHSLLPSPVSRLWNLQTLIFRGASRQIVTPSEIWYMRQLRHLHFNKVYLPDPPLPPIDKMEQQDDIILPNLQTFSKVVNFSFTKEVCKRIPDVKKLCVVYDDFSGECQKKCCFNLHKLQSLSCFFWKAPKRGDLLQSLMFSSSLRKLCLYNCRLHWEDLNAFGLALPHLEVLKLYDDAFVGTEWDCVEGAFPRLKFLHISRVNLISWTAEYSDIFPMLENLRLEDLKKLEKIPSGMGDIDTLGYLHLDSCSVPAAISSMEILEEQLSLGNEELKVEVMFLNGEEEKRFREKVEIERYRGKNFVADNHEALGSRQWELNRDWTDSEGEDSMEWHKFISVSSTITVDGTDFDSLSAI